MHRKGTAVDVLLVEDNPADIRLTREAFKEARSQNRLHVVRDGVDAIAFLRRQTPYEHAVHADIILLDLNLPKKDGLEVLEEVKADEDLRMIPVVVLTTSTSDEDIRAGYLLHANAFVAKPVDFESFSEIVRTIEDFWLTSAVLPPANDAHMEPPADPGGSGRGGPAPDVVIIDPK
jgi:chemotaxis family two-component system response regulator Rcp1